VCWEEYRLQAEEERRAREGGLSEAYGRGSMGIGGGYGSVGAVGHGSGAGAMASRPPQVRMGATSVSGRAALAAATSSRDSESPTVDARPLQASRSDAGATVSPDGPEIKPPAQTDEAATLRGPVERPRSVVRARWAPRSATPRPSAAVGYLSITTLPWSTVFCDDKKLGVTPLFRLELPAGEHRLRLVNERGKAVSRRIFIRAGQVTKLSVSLPSS